jgi:hypothetical protein
VRFPVALAQVGVLLLNSINDLSASPLSASFELAGPGHAFLSLGKCAAHFDGESFEEALFLASLNDSVSLLRQILIWGSEKIVEILRFRRF